MSSFLIGLNTSLFSSLRYLISPLGFDCSKQVTYYCRECLFHLHVPDQTECLNGCSLHRKRRPFMNVSELVINDVKEEIRSTAQRYFNLINEYADCAHRVLPADIPNGSIHQRLRSNGERQLTIMLYTDGAPVTTIGGKSLWPIQATIVEIPPPVRDHASAVMVFAAWLSGSHPDRDLLWGSVVLQLQQLSIDGITLRSSDESKLKFNVRVQLVTFDLPAMAQNCNIVQFNGYDACPYCKQHGYAIGTQIFYPHEEIPSSRKTDEHYVRGATSKLPRSRSIGIKGPTPLTKIILFPVQIAIDYMHLTCSGHCKTLIKYWSNLLLPHVFDQASNHLCSCILTHSFGYQFMSLIHFGNWKTKMFRYADGFTTDDRKITLIRKGGTRPVRIC